MHPLIGNAALLGAALNQIDLLLALTVLTIVVLTLAVARRWKEYCDDRDRREREMSEFAAICREAGRAAAKLPGA